MAEIKKRAGARVVDRATRVQGEGDKEDFPNKKPVPVKKKTIDTDSMQYKY
jgi:hypothetical protein